MTGQRSGDDAEPLLAPGAAGPSLTAVPLPDTDSDGGSERGSRSSALPASGSRTLRAGGGGSGGVGGDNPFPFPSPFRLYDGLPLWRRYPLPSACVVVFGALVVLWLLVGLLFGGGASSDTLGLGKLGVASAGSSDPGTLAMIAELLKARNASQPPIPIPALFDRVDGYFTLFRGTGLAQGRVLLEVPASELDKPFIITAMYAAGDSEIALTHMPAETVDHNAFAFRKSDAIFAAIDLYRPMMDLRVADNTSAMAKSYKEGTWPGWLKTFGVLHNVTSDGYLFDATDWVEDGMFVIESDSGDPDPKHKVSYGARFLNATAFPRNVELDVQMRARSVTALGESLLSPENIFSFIVHYSVVALPEEPMTVRMADERLGFFGQTYVSVDADRALHDKRTLLQRWDLTKRLPVVYHVDPTVPTAWRQAMKEGVEEWNKAFKAAGHPDAVRAILPDDDKWPEDYAAGDVRYNSISWAPSLGSTYALGPSDVDPRTGEVLNADIVFTHGWVRAWLRDYREFVGDTGALSRFSVPPVAPSTARGRALKRAEERLATRSFVDGERVDDLGVQMLLATHRLREWETGAAVARAATLNTSTAAASATSDVIDLGTSSRVVSGADAYIIEALKEVVMHEVGHTLGLRHNFRASGNIPWASLSDAKYVEEHGLSSSVMDYMPVLVRADPADQTHYYTNTIGAYDYAAIKYGYGDFKTEAELSAFAEKAATEYGLTFATDSDGADPDGPDPLASLWDMSATPLDYHENVLQLTRKVVTRLMNATAADDTASWLDFTASMESAIRVTARSVQYATKFVGGQLPSRAHSSGKDGVKPGASVPLRPVDGATQAKALSLILAELNPRSGMLGATTAATYGPYMVHRVGSHCEVASKGCLGFASSDVPQLLRELRGKVLGSLLHPDRLNRLSASRAMASDGIPSVASLLRQITDTLFMTPKGGAPSRSLVFPTDRATDAVVDDLVLDAQAQWLRMLLEQVDAPVYEPTENHPLAVIALAGEISRIHEGARLAAKARPEDAHLRGVLWMTRKFASNLNDGGSVD